MVNYDTILSEVELYAYLDPKDASSLVSKILKEMEDLGFIPSRRAEGYALLPMGSPVPTHLRLGIYEAMVTFWVRGVGDIENSSKHLGMSPQELFDALMRGIRKAAEIFNSYQDKGSVRTYIPGEDI